MRERRDRCQRDIDDDQLAVEIEAIWECSGRTRTTVVDRHAPVAEDLVARNFNPPAPDVTWCGDITYIPTGEGWLFLATVIDLYSRRVIGWGVAEHLRTPLVAAALG